MSSCAPCLPPKGQLFHFPVTEGPLLILGEATPCGPNPVCPPACCPGPTIPRGTVVFFSPAKVAPPYRPPLPPVTPRPTPVASVGNDEQTCEYPCPPGTTGETITVTVPVDTYFRGTKEEANAAALAAACAQAAALRAASPCEGVDPEPPTCTIECQSKEAVASLIGCPEWGTPISVPPRLYRRGEHSGSSTNTTYEDGACSIPHTPNISVTCVHTAWWQWDPITGVVTRGGGTTCFHSNGTTQGPFPSGGNCPVQGADSCDAVWVRDSATVISRHTTGVCCLDEGIFRKSNSDSFTITLSDEDTEADAIIRALLAIPTWTVSDCETITAYRGVRTGTQVTFPFRSMQTRVIFGTVDNPLEFGHTYEATVGLERRILGSGDPFVPLGDITFQTTASAPTMTSDWADIPNAAGFETRAVGCSLEDIT